MLFANISKSVARDEWVKVIEQRSKIIATLLNTSYLCDGLTSVILSLQGSKLYLYALSTELSV